MNAISQIEIPSRHGFGSPQLARAVELISHHTPDAEILSIGTFGGGNGTVEYWAVVRRQQMLITFIADAWMDDEEMHFSYSRFEIADLPCDGDATLDELVRQKTSLAMIWLETPLF